MNIINLLNTFFKYKIKYFESVSDFVYNYNLKNDVYINIMFYVVILEAKCKYKWISYFIKKW